MRSDILFWSQKRTKILRLHCSASPSQDDRGDADPKPRRPWRSGAMRLIRRVKAKFAITLGFNENFIKALLKNTSRFVRKDGVVASVP